MESQVCANLVELEDCLGKGVFTRKSRGFDTAENEPSKIWQLLANLVSLPGEAHIRMPL